MSPLEDFSRYATIIPEEHLPALARNLKRIPDFEWLLGSPNAEIQRLQGGLLVDFPTVFLDDSASPRPRSAEWKIVYRSLLESFAATPRRRFSICLRFPSSLMERLSCYTWFAPYRRRSIRNRKRWAETSE